MFKRIAIAAALATSASFGWAGTVIGGATLLDTATVLPGTVTPTTFLTYVSGGGATGDADGSTYNLLALTGSQAMDHADHLWLQFDPPILMHSNTVLSDVIAVPAIDHGWTSGNTNEFWESFEFIVWGCVGTVFSSTACEEGHITKVWTLGVDNAGLKKNADDWTTQWHFNGPTGGAGGYNNFFITSGDRLDHGQGTRGAYSPGEGEIDALAAAPIPEPETYALFAAGLAALGFMTRRRRERR